MTVINRADVVAPVFPEEETFVAEFGGEVIVKALTLRERLAMAEDEGDGAARMASMLHLCVVDVERQPIFTAEQWEIFASRHIDTVMRLWDTARSLSGLEKIEGEKKETATID